jgi:hypothetical protein
LQRRADSHGGCVCALFAQVSRACLGWLPPRLVLLLLRYELFLFLLLLCDARLASDHARTALLLRAAGAPLAEPRETPHRQCGERSHERAAVLSRAAAHTAAA